MDFIPNPTIIPVGIFIRFLVAAPIGPVNLLCIQRTIERGSIGSIPAILGAVIGDGLIALFAALGVGAISGACEHHRFGIQIVGGFALIYFGMNFFSAMPRIFSEKHTQNFNTSIKNYAWDIPQAFFLTISNPGAVLGFFAIFGGISTFVEIHTSIDAFTIVVAIMGGGLSWWFLLSTIISRFRHFVDQENLRKINRTVGLIVVFFGLVLLSEILFKIKGSI